MEKITLNPADIGDIILDIEDGIDAAAANNETDAAARVQQLMAEGLSRKDAVKQTAKELDLPKNVVYDIALKDSE